MININLLVTSVIVMASLGAILGLGLNIAYRKLKVEEDPKLKEVLEALPGLNCGACGYASCEEFAKHLMEGNASLGGCKVGGEDLAKKLQTILGKNNTANEDIKKARFKCNAIDTKKTKVADYKGIKSCLAAHSLGASYLGCLEGCLALGDCAAICPVGAIEIKEGRPRLNLTKCTGCGLCIKSCPRKLIDLVTLRGELKKLVVIGCNCTLTGPLTVKNCKAGCIACGKCVKICPVNAIILDSYRAIIDISKCTGCGECIGVCPTGAIYLLENK